MNENIEKVGLKMSNEYIIYDKYDHSNRKSRVGSLSKYATRSGKVTVLIQGEGNDKGHWDGLIGSFNTRGCQVKEYIPCIDAYIAEVTLDSLDLFEEDPQVSMVTLDRTFYALLNIASPTIGANRIWNTTDFTGKGITVAVIDSGVYPHPDLTKPENRIIHFVDYVNNRTNPYDDNGHGTHVCGIVAGNGYQSSGKYKGVAPGANIIGIKSLNSKGSGSESAVLRGIQWCINNKNKYNIKVLSMSLGATASVEPSKDLLVRAIESAWKAGIFVTLAAGNSGPGENTINTPGISPLALTVGSMDDRRTLQRNDDIISNFSSRGPAIGGHNKPDVLAPGSNIVSLGVKVNNTKSFLDYFFGFFFGQRSLDTNNYATKSGTSMATPFCAGLSALLYEKYPNASPQDIKNLITTTSENFGLDKTIQGHGYIDGFSAIK